jgi:RNA processing factor Prp31
MRHVSDKHSKLISDLENNYRSLETETEQYYNDILEKWKEVIKEKVYKYKQQYEAILIDKNQTLEELQIAIQVLTSNQSF